MSQARTISADFHYTSHYIEVHGSKLHYVDEGIHFLQEDHPDLIGSELASWYRTL